MALGVGAAVANAVVVALGCVGAVGVGLALARWARAGYAAAGRRARMRGQVAIITGGSSGIGLAIARRLVERGMKVVLAARGETQLSAAAKELKALGGDVHAVPTDISSEQACKAMVQAALDRHGRLDLVVACAGIGHHGLASKDTRELQLSLLEVNHLGTVSTIQAALPALLQFGGELLVMNSVSGAVGSPLRSAYCASKYATTGYIEALRLELQMLGTPLPITMVMPGSVDTPFRKHNIGPRPKMSAGSCADIAVAGYERGDYKVFAPAHAQLLLSVPHLLGQWALDLFMINNQKKLFHAVVTAQHPQ